jgi:signal transduction histidine kinase/DNA-binding NarL/FixJ family response regulator
MESSLKLLVVDDSAVDRLVICQALQLAGLELSPIEVESQAVAIAALESEGFDCVLVDADLPNEDGLRLVQTIQQSGFPSATVVILGEANQRRAEAFLQAGAGDYLSKPEMAPDTLCHRVWNAVRLRRMEIKAAAALKQLDKVRQENQRLTQVALSAEQERQSNVVVLAEQQQQLRTLQRLTDLLNQRLTNLPGLLQLMIDAVCDTITQAQFGLILLYDDKSQGLELTATVGISQDTATLVTTFSPQDGILGQVFQTGESQLIRIPAANRINQPTKIPAALCTVAIESPQAGRLGVLAVGNWQDETAFDDEDLRLLIAFGEQAAIALNNAQLINALEEREERLAFQNTILAQQNQELATQRQQIQVQNVRLLEATHLKSQFLATMSHELRTPMNAIIGFSQLLLRQNQLAPTQRDMVNRILNNGKHLLALINDILDLSKIEAGRLELKLEKFPLPDLLNATLQELRSLADQKRLGLIHHSRLQNPYVINDSGRLRQVIVNLLSNAIKFTETGQVELDVRELNADRIVIVVRDTGIGIAPQHVPHIFEEFRQLDQSSTRRHSGTGLGLAITRWLIQLMGGHISVTSQLGQGSTFRIDLPREIRAKAPTIPEPSRPEASMPKPSRPEASMPKPSIKNPEILRNGEKAG